MNTDTVILIVDDEKDHADVLVEALAKQCAKAIPAYTAEEALEIIDTEPVDLVITTPHCADMSPVQLAEAIKQRRPELPVIMLSYDRLTAQTYADLVAGSALANEGLVHLTALPA